MWTRKSLQPQYDISITIPDSLIKLLMLIPDRKISQPPKTLVLSGGSTKGTAHLGAVKALDELGYLKGIKRFVGVSIGGLIASLLAIGYSYKDLYNKIMDLDFSTMQEISPSQIFDIFGVDKGDRFVNLIRELIRVKCNPDITLSQVHKLTGHSIHVLASCVNNCRLTLFNRTTFPDIPLWKAIRITTSIPGLFAPMMHNGLMYVDGACIDNFPINIFNSNKTLGVFLRVLNNSIEIKNLEDYVAQMFIMMMSNTSKSENSYPEKTVFIHLPFINNFDFKMSKEIKQILIDTGYRSTIEHFIQNI
jgi:predicted acylesterase/phospholipase RssA